MANYFRITAYHPEHYISIIMDAYGLFDKVWQFSSELVKKGFKIIEVGNDEKFLDGEISKVEEVTDKYILRAEQSGKPTNVAYSYKDLTYVAIKVGDKLYIPDATKIV